MRRLVIAALATSLVALIALSADEPAAPKELVRSYTGHTEAVYAVAVSPDGKQLLTGSFDRTVKLFDFASGKELKTFGGEKGHQNLVLTVAFAPDGQTFASGGSDNTVKIWDVPLAKALREVALGDAGTAAAISADGKSAAAGGKDGSIKVLNPADGKELFTLKGHVGAITVLAYAPNNPQSLASTGVDGTLRFWNLADGKPVAVVVAHEKPIHSLAFATNGAQVYTAGDDGAIKFWQVPPVAPRPLAGHADSVRALALTGDGNSAVTGSLDKNVRVFNIDNGQLGRTLPAPQPVTAVAAVGVGANAFTFAGTSTGQLLAWGADAKPIYQGVAHAGEIAGLAVSPNGAQLVSVGADGNLVVWALPFAAARTIAQPADVKSAFVTSDGKRVITVNADNQVRFWTTNNDQAEKAIPVTATMFAATLDGSAFVFAAADNTLTYQKRDGGTPSKLPNQPGVTALAFHPNGSQVLVAYADGSLKLWPQPFPDKMPKPIWESKLAGVRKLVFEPNGNRFFVIAADKTLHFGDGKIGKELPPLGGHDGALVDVALSGDGSRVATSDDKVAIVRALADLKDVARITLPAAATRLALSPKGDRLAIAHALEGKTAISIFDVATGRKLLMPDDRFAAFSGLAFDPATRALMIAGDKTVSLIDVPAIAVLPAHAGGATGVAFAPNNALLTCGKDKSVKQWDVATGKEMKTLGLMPDPASAVAVSRDGAQFAVAGGKSAKVWNLADGKEVITLTHRAEVISISFSADRTRIVTGTTDNMAYVWDAAKGNLLQAFGHGAAVYSVAMPVTKPNVVITASADKTAVVHTTTNLRHVPASVKPIRSLVAVPNGSHLLAAGDDGVVQLINLGNGLAERKFDGPAGPVLAVAVSRNGQLVAAAGADKIIRVFTYNDGALVGQFPATGIVRSLTFHPSNTALLSSGDDKSATMWNIAFQPGNPPPAEFGKPIQRFEHPGAVAAAALSNDGTLLVSGADDKVARVWKVAADGPTKNLQHPNLVDCVAYNKDGTQLATGCHDGIVRIFDVAKGTPLKTINAHTQPAPSAVYSVVWSPDGKQIATGSLDKSVKIWDATSGNLVKEIKGYDEKSAPKGHRDGVFVVAWSPDGKQLLSGSSDRTIKLWNAADGNLVRDFANTGLPNSPMQPAASHPGWVYHLRFTTAGQVVSVGGAPRGHGYIALWNPGDGRLLFGADMALGPFYHVALAPDGAFAVACGPRTRGAPTADAVLLKLPAK
jgi:WD40 repeat protein